MLVKATDIVKYYLRDDIKNALLEFFDSREIALQYINGKFSERPYLIVHEGDYEVAVKNFVTSFHCSVERWENVNVLKSKNAKEIEKNRIGWDLLIDLDAKTKDREIGIKVSKIAAEVIIKKIKIHGVKNILLKYSGNKGFHILIPFESFPKKINKENICFLFPSSGRIVIDYLKEICKEEMKELFIENLSLKEIEGFNIGKEIDPYEIVELDPMLLSPRHLFRAPYSLNEKSWLVSLPIGPKELSDFDPKDAIPSKVAVNDYFKIKKANGDASLLFLQAYDWFQEKFATEVRKKVKNYKYPLRAIPEEYFPPCIKNILKGLEDGRKRALFILVNFLRGVGYTIEEIEEKIREWNQRNTPPLRESYIRSQLKWFRKIKKLYLPPNCDNLSYYKDIGVCNKDTICNEIKNPLTYPFKVKKKWKKK